MRLWLAPPPGKLLTTLLCPRESVPIVCQLLLLRIDELLHLLIHLCMLHLLQSSSSKEAAVLLLELNFQLNLETICLALHSSGPSWPSAVLQHHS